LDSKQTIAQIEHEVVTQTICQRAQNAYPKPRGMVGDRQLRDSTFLIR